MSSSNLNDIASALEKLNISDEQIATIKSYLTDVSGYDQIQNGLGQLVSVLATARNQDKENIEELNSQIQQKGNCSFGTLQYTGNGGSSVRLSIGIKPDMLILTNSSEGNWVYPAYSSDTSTIYLAGEGNSFRATYSGGTLTIDVSGSSIPPLNRANRVYNVIYFY